MFGWISKEERKQELLAEIRAEEENHQAELKAAVETAKERERAKIAAEEADRKVEAAKMKASDEPWVTIKGMIHDPKKGIRIELDWNDAFVKHLRNNGYKGVGDDAVIQRYIAVMAKQVAEDMSEDQINENE